ncbi:MAG: flavin monoamine oxidase family protein [Gammaproteobacteria bacterium]
MHTDVLIIGAGLSGLHTAYECHKRGTEYCVLEARDRIGGRVLSWNAEGSEYNPQLAGVDLGPSWFWPGQNRIYSLLAELGLEGDVFFQNGKGDAVYEDNQGVIQRGVDGISMSGAYRLKGGIRQLISRLGDELSSDAINTNAVVTEIKRDAEIITARYKTENFIEEITCQRLVIALPPRVALTHITFEPVLSNERIEQLNGIATWMAGHAKLVCVYEQQFWSEQGLSGDAISHRGPLQEIHDASSDDQSLYALFGFLGVPVVNRRNRQDELKNMAIKQLARMFGEQALKPKIVYLQDWAMESYTSTQLDQEIQRFHPMNNIGYVSEPTWQDKIIWSGSEAADYRQHNNGFLEGALEASMHTLSLLNKINQK